MDLGAGGSGVRDDVDGKFQIVGGADTDEGLQGGEDDQLPLLLVRELDLVAEGVQGLRRH
jgi:hypothetical protein